MTKTSVLLHKLPLRSGTWSTSLSSEPPNLVSESCAESLTTLLQEADASSSSSLLLALVVESSSHPDGIATLWAQPYVYAGGGLGNMDECPLQTCLAGTTRRDSLTSFASVCIPSQCNALDLAAEDFPAALIRALPIPSGSDNVTTTTITRSSPAQTYVELHDNIHELNHFLGTGWVCGNWTLPWTTTPVLLGMYTGAVVTLVACALYGTLFVRSKRTRHIVPVQQHPHPPQEEGVSLHAFFHDEEKKQEFSFHEENVHMEDDEDEFDDENDEDGSAEQVPLVTPTTVASDSGQKNPRTSRRNINNDNDESLTTTWVGAWDVTQHLERLQVPHSSDTACLDGMRVISLGWIMMGHLMAIFTSTGPGYINPAAILPPHGWTTTFTGQLVFSSRLAVDTFFCISGYLVVTILHHRREVFQCSPRESLGWCYLRHLPALVVARLVRILPLYAFSIGLYALVAPHLGGGPFWYQWMSLLEPCHDYGWTNLLFINNFLPWDTATSDTCFYHSWYLAVDMQLFLLAPLLVLLYQRNAVQGQRFTLGLWLVFVMLQTYLTYVRGWSLNTFDGAAVAFYDVEAYAKPHVRAQSYLAGMYCAMNVLPRLPHRTAFTRQHVLVLLASLMAMALVTFVTVTGAYARRPCSYEEWPHVNQCGSLWPQSATFVYTAMSRAVWVVAVAAIIHLSVGRTHVVATMLSWRGWTPLSHLSYGAYLIHPIIMFVWQLGEREKQVFRLFTFGMNYLSVCVVTYLVSLVAALVVELPVATLWKSVIQKYQPHDDDSLLQRPEPVRSDRMGPRDSSNYGSMERKV